MAQNVPENQSAAKNITRIHSLVSAGELIE